MASPIGEGSLTITGFYEFMLWKVALQVKWGGLFGSDSTWGPGWGSPDDQAMWIKLSRVRGASTTIISSNSLNFFSMGFLCQRESLSSMEHESWGWGGICCVPQLCVSEPGMQEHFKLSVDRQSGLSHMDLVHILVLSLGQVTF